MVLAYMSTRSDILVCTSNEVNFALLQVIPKVIAKILEYLGLG